MVVQLYLRSKQLEGRLIHLIVLQQVVHPSKVSKTTGDTLQPELRGVMYITSSSPQSMDMHNVALRTAYLISQRIINAENDILIQRSRKRNTTEKV